MLFVYIFFLYSRLPFVCVCVCVSPSPFSPSLVDSTVSKSASCDKHSNSHTRYINSSETPDKTSTDSASSTSHEQEHDKEDEQLWIRIVFTPTVPHCSLATLIGLCLRIKLERCLEGRFKLDILVSEGTHTIEGDVNKQINDKERVAAAMENPNLREMVETCIREAEY